MKNLTLAAIAFVCLSSFTTVNLNVITDISTIACKWRTVYTHSNGDVSYTEWTHGECNVTDSGKLIPIQ
ncbi:MAG: hypothetical protein RLZZ529_1679 [Bacteroidota bacterium]|jgi:hypothetical protein